MRPIAIAAAVGFLVGCARNGDDADVAETDATEVRALFDSIVADVRAANWTAWSNRFSEDGQFHAANTPALVGRPALVAWAQAFPPIESFSFENVQVTREGNFAYGTSAVLLKLKDLPADTSKQLVVMKRDSANMWQVVAVSFTSDLPAPPPPPAPARR